MANYLVRSCSSTDEYIVSADTLSIDDVISFYFGESILCGTVLSQTTNNHNSIYKSLFMNCCECLQTELQIISFAFQPCEGGELIFIDINTFCNVYGDSPIIDQVFRFFNLEDSSTLCAEMRGYDTEISGITVLEPDEGPFVNCTLCLPRSANTETNLCLEICTESGTTVVSVTPPHPEWTDGYGIQVTELNMITLGGMNGLNN